MREVSPAVRRLVSYKPSQLDGAFQDDEASVTILQAFRLSLTLVNSRIERMH
jgi:hypothetical protein